MGGGDFLNRRDDRNGEVDATAFADPRFTLTVMSRGVEPVATKATSLEITIRPNNPRGYILSVYRFKLTKHGPMPGNQAEMYLAQNIEEVEGMVAQLLRKGKVT
jgi:hypothetical protein